jgi:hypothetical protein
MSVCDNLSNLQSHGHKCLHLLPVVTGGASGPSLLTAHSTTDYVWSRISFVVCHWRLLIVLCALGTGSQVITG